MKTVRSILLIVFVMSMVFTSSAFAQDASPNAPEDISVFTITPNPAAIGTSVEFTGTYDLLSGGTNMTAFCFYFATADFAAWDANFAALDSDASLAFTKSALPGFCPAVAGFGRLGFYASDTSAAVFGDNFRASVVVPGIALGTKIIAVRQYEGLDCDGSTGVGTDTPGSAACAFRNFRPVTNFVVQAPPSIVYAGTAGCDGYTPCYTSLASAFTAVAAGGEIRVVASMPFESLLINKDVTLRDYDGTGTITGGLTPYVLFVSSGTVTIQDLNINVGWATDIVGVDGGTVTVKGNTLFGGNIALTATSGSLTAYANNITGNVTGVNVTGGTFNGRHNWWGDGVTSGDVNNADAWTYRLGADVFAWGEGTLGGASITPDTASGTGVIVSHGRGEANAPFGKATTADGNTQCSDYYDFFTAPGAFPGNWYVEVPVDAGTGCDFTYNNRQVFTFDLLPGGIPNTACTTTDCWNDLKDTAGETLVHLGRSAGIRWSTASTEELAGTPIVTGNQDGNDPTAIVLESIEASSQNVWLPVAILAILLALGAGVMVVLRRGSSLI